MLQRIFQRYTGFLRTLKAVYVLNNWLNVKYLRHNLALYRKYGLRKSIFSPVGSRDFAGRESPDVPWLDRPGAAGALEQNSDFQVFNPERQAQIRNFEQQGFLLLPGFFPKDATDALNAEVEQLLGSGAAGFNYTGRKIFNLFESSALARDVFFKNPELLALLQFLLGRPVLPFQSLNFVQGSEQRIHSDSIHMTTEPRGYLIAIWIALEDCGADCGPLSYYPGSHRLPYLMTPDYASGNTTFTIGTESNRRYEDAIAALIAEQGLTKQIFTAQRGDVFIWHANLLHGGSPITRPGATRRSMVCHYFAEGVICYHEMSQRPALLKHTT